MKQTSFSDLAYEHKKKTTRKERFLGEMEAILPWDELLKPIDLPPVTTPMFELELRFI